MCLVKALYLARSHFSEQGSHKAKSYITGPISLSKAITEQEVIKAVNWSHFSEQGYHRARSKAVHRSHFSKQSSNRAQRTADK